MLLGIMLVVVAGIAVWAGIIHRLMARARAPGGGAPRVTGPKGVVRKGVPRTPRRGDAKPAAPARAVALTGAPPGPPRPIPAVTPPTGFPMMPGTARNWLDVSPLIPAPLGTRPGRPAAAKKAADSTADLMAYRIAKQIRSRQGFLEALAKPSLDPSAMTEVAMADPVLASEILKVVNSPFFGLRQPVASVFRAVLLLGHLEVRNIVWRVSCADSGVTVETGAGQEFLDSLWSHAFDASRVAYALSRSCGVGSPDSIATAALLHDIGKLLSLHASGPDALALWSSFRFSGHETLREETRLFGLSHDLRGGQAAEVWGLPEETRAAIAHHHAPSYILPGELAEHQVPIALVHLADLLCHLVRPAAAAMEASAPSDAPAAPIYLPRDGWLALVGLRDIREISRLDQVARALRPPGSRAA